MTVRLEVECPNCGKKDWYGLPEEDFQRLDRDTDGELAVRFYCSRCFQMFEMDGRDALCQKIMKL